MSTLTATSPEALLRLLQGAATVVAALLVATSLAVPTVLGGVATVTVALVTFAVAFGAAAAAEWVADEPRRALASGLGAGLFLVVAVGSEPVAVVAAAGLLLVGVVLFAGGVARWRARDLSLGREQR